MKITQRPREGRGEAAGIAGGIVEGTEKVIAGGTGGSGGYMVRPGEFERGDMEGSGWAGVSISSCQAVSVKGDTDLVSSQVYQ
jgi:hypothetical protein